MPSPGRYVPCTVSDCSRPAKSKTLCPRHARVCRTYFENDPAYTAAWLTAHPACDSCGSPAALRVDHDHSHCRTGCKTCVRGRLCHGCNVAEGYLGGDPARAQALAEYMVRTAVPALAARVPEGSIET